MIEDFYLLEPYELDKKAKNKLLTKELKGLTDVHRKKCKEYGRLLNTLQYNEEDIKNIEDIPFFPVRMFKEYDLLSVDSKDVFKVMTSSGTTGQKVSKIYVDKETAMIQQKVMIKNTKRFLGKKKIANADR